MIWKNRVISFIWGLSEATFFFFVPDIWLSYLVLTRKKEAYTNILYSTIGALLGGCLMYVLATSYFDSMLRFLSHIPGISPTLTTTTGQQIQDLGFLNALIAGVFSGVPYKIYATWAGHFNLPVLSFVFCSTLARFLRFLAVTSLAQMLAYLFKSALTRRHLYFLHAFAWIIFYIAYFYHMGF